VGWGQELQVIDEELVVPQWDPDEAGAAAKVEDSEARSKGQSDPNRGHSPDEQRVPGERKQSGSARILKFVGKSKGH
jgi:hypothetical protein